MHSPAYEREHAQGLLVEPLGVIDAGQQRPLLRGLRKQRERRKPHQELIGGRAVGQSTRHPQRRALRLGQRAGLLETVQERYEQTVQRREREPGLRLHTRHPQDAQVGGLRSRMLQQHSLADAGVTA